MGGKCEFSLVTISAVVHNYGSDNRWIIVGPSRVGIYHDTDANTFRIVARKIDEHEVVANCAISDTFCYDESTPSFHQWRDGASKVYGIKFASLDEAALFSDTIRRIVHTFEQVHKVVESMSSMTVEQQPQLNGAPRPDKRNSPVSQASPVQQFSSPLLAADSTTILIGRSPKPVPPPPPPPQNGYKATSNQNLASGTAASKATTTQSKPGPSFLNEMELTLARRRAKIDAMDEAVSEERNHSFKDCGNNNSAVSTFMAKSASALNQTNLDSSSSESIGSTPSAFDRLKQEILCEIREELILFKRDLLQSIKEELSRSQRQ